jgi:hypothetical protein
MSNAVIADWRHRKAIAVPSCLKPSKEKPPRLFAGRHAQRLKSNANPSPELSLATYVTFSVTIQMRFSRIVCPLVAAPGWWIPASAIHPPAPATLRNSWEAVDALGIIPAAPDNPIPIVQHAMPCICPACPDGEGAPLLQVPLKGTSSPFAPALRAGGVQSGRRSTIVGASRTRGAVDWAIAYDADGAPLYPEGDNPEFFLRIKGNGMWIPPQPVPFPGITLAPLPSLRHEGVDTLQVRGTAFPKTATYDIVNNPQINAMLALFGLRGNNVPLGLWRYAPMDGDPAPNIPKVCSVLKTIADLRLESNVLAGLEQIIFGMARDVAVGTLTLIRGLYAQNGMECPGNENRTYKRTKALAFFPANDAIARVLGAVDPITIPTLTPEKVRDGGLLPSESVYETIPEAAAVNGKSFRTLARLFGRLGWEAGRCIAAVHRAGYNWGTYQDHSCDGILDNAHANNICILPRELMDLGNGLYQLLVPTDFDMSFKKEQAVNTWVNPPCPEPLYVAEFPSTELENMLGNLSGYTAALDGVQTGISKRDPVECTPQMELVWVMRDVTAWEYLRGYQRPADPGYAPNGITLEEAVQFIPEALELTSDIVV